MATNVSAVGGSSAPAAKKPFVMNPDALPFHPTSFDKHCIFLTFSNGFPLRESQIFAFFNWLYAPYVEAVYVHKPTGKGSEAKPPLFGKVVFKHEMIPDLILGDKEKVGFYVEGRPIHCSRFVTKKSKPAAKARSSVSPPGGESHQE